MSIKRNIKSIACNMYKKLQPYVIAIYLGGSSVDKYIKNKGDVDYIIFVRKASDKPIVQNLINFILGLKINEFNKVDNQDFMNIRTLEKEEKEYGSYINKMMIKLVGQTIKFEYDVIDKDREDYIKKLKAKILDLTKNRWKNQKRWYQILRGIYIIKNKSYKLTKEQAENINKFHDLNFKEEEIYEIIYKEFNDIKDKK